PALSRVRRERAMVSDIRRPLLRHHGDSIVNAGVAGAAADVAGHRLVDLLGTGLGIASEQRAGVHKLTGLAIAALHDIVVHPRLLQCASDGTFSKGLDGRDLLAVE